MKHFSTQMVLFKSRSWKYEFPFLKKNGVDQPITNLERDRRLKSLETGGLVEIEVGFIFLENGATWNAIFIKREWHDE